MYTTVDVDIDGNGSSSISVLRLRKPHPRVFLPYYYIITLSTTGSLFPLCSALLNDIRLPFRNINNPTLDLRRSGKHETQGLLQKLYYHRV